MSSGEIVAESDGESVRLVRSMGSTKSTPSLKSSHHPTGGCLEIYLHQLHLGPLVFAGNGPKKRGFVAVADPRWLLESFDRPGVCGCLCLLCDWSTTRHRREGQGEPASGNAGNMSARCRGFLFFRSFAKRTFGMP